MTPNKLQRGQNQRQKILDSARRAFWERGYDKTTMRNIAIACGFEPPNIYNYFPNKENILYQVLLDEMEGLISSIQHLENSGKLSPTERLRLLFKNHYRFTLGDTRDSRLLFDTELRNLTPSHHKEIVRLRDTYERIVGSILQDGVKTGEFAGIDEKLVCYAISSIISRSRLWFSPKGRLSRDEIAESMSRLVLNGLRVRQDD